MGPVFAARGECIFRCICTLQSLSPFPCIIEIAFIFFIITGPGIVHRGVLISNNSLITRTDIGVDDDAVYCVVDDANCCGTPSAGNGRGEWYFPLMGMYLHLKTQPVFKFYASWTTGAVLMNYRGTDGGGASGVFSCKIQDANNILHTFYLGVYPINEGKYVNM